MVKALRARVHEIPVRMSPPLYISFFVHIRNPVMYRDSLYGNVLYS